MQRLNFESQGQRFTVQLYAAPDVFAVRFDVLKRLEHSILFDGIEYATKPDTDKPMIYFLMGKSPVCQFRLRLDDAHQLKRFIEANTLSLSIF
ncbi:hypothetical protein [Pseudoalteromonas xiamenensis]